MKKLPVAALLLVVIAGFSRSGLAAKDEQYYPELQNDEDMRVLESEKNMLSSGFQYGAWITPVFIFQEAPQNKLTTLVTTFRVWMKTYLWDNSYLYLRGEDTSRAVLRERGVASARNKNVLDLDLGFIAMGMKRKAVHFT